MAIVAWKTTPLSELLSSEDRTPVLV